ncbi:MAG: hypothetical protein R2690_20850 [Acidimicrobiales bacterium]
MPDDLAQQPQVPAAVEVVQASVAGSSMTSSTARGAGDGSPASSASSSSVRRRSGSIVARSTTARTIDSLSPKW